MALLHVPALIEKLPSTSSPHRVHRPLRATDHYFQGKGKKNSETWKIMLGATQDPPCCQKWRGLLQVSMGGEGSTGAWAV